MTATLEYAQKRNGEFAAWLDGGNFPDVAAALAEAESRGLAPEDYMIGGVDGVALAKHLERDLHTRLSRLVAGLKIGERLFSREWSAYNERQHALKAPGGGHSVRVYFGESDEHPDAIVIRTTNYRAEDEPSGWVPKAEARAIWRRLVDAGMVAF